MQLISNVYQSVRNAAVEIGSKMGHLYQEIVVIGTHTFSGLRICHKVFLGVHEFSHAIDFLTKIQLRIHILAMGVFVLMGMLSYFQLTLMLFPLSLYQVGKAYKTHMQEEKVKGVKALQQEHLQLQKRYRELNALVASLKQQKLSVDGQITLLKNMILQQVGLNKSLEEICKELEKKQQEYFEVQQKISASVAELHIVQQELQQTKDGLQEIHQALQRDLEEQRKLRKAP